MMTMTMCVGAPRRHLDWVQLGPTMCVSAPRRQLDLGSFGAHCRVSSEVGRLGAMCVSAPRRQLDWVQLGHIPKEKTIHVSNFDHLKNELQKFIKNYKVNNKLFEEFKSVIQARDKYRKVSIFNYMPEVAKEVFTK